MRRWQYRRVVIDGAAFVRGEGDGEMERLTVAVPRDKHGYQHEVCLVFKRPDPETRTRVGEADATGWLGQSPKTRTRVGEADATGWLGQSPKTRTRVGEADATG